MRCTVCESKKKLEAKTQNIKYDASGLDNVVICAAKVYHCDNCGERYLQYGNRKEIDIAIADALLKIIVSDKNTFGIYNYSNQGQCSWYDFAKKVFEINNTTIDLKAIPTTSFPTLAKRPKYSVLDKTKIKRVFGLKIKKWEESLRD